MSGLVDAHGVCIVSLPVGNDADDAHEHDHSDDEEVEDVDNKFDQLGSPIRLNCKAVEVLWCRHWKQGHHSRWVTENNKNAQPGASSACTKIRAMESCEHPLFRTHFVRQLRRGSFADVA